MGKLIDADALIEKCGGWYTEEGTEEGFIGTIKQLLEAQPEAIVRCVDCKYWREYKYAKETKRYMPFCVFNAIYTKADDFCSHGERRTE